MLLQKDIYISIHLFANYLSNISYSIYLYIDSSCTISIFYFVFTCTSQNILLHYFICFMCVICFMSYIHAALLEEPVGHLMMA